MSTFRIVFTHEFSLDDFKSIFSHFGNVAEVTSQEARMGNSSGYTYIIRMETWTKSGEEFRNHLLEHGSLRYCYDDSGYRPWYMFCEPVR